MIRTETVVIRGVGCQNKFKLHLREQVAEVLGIGIEHLIAPAGNDHLFLFICRLSGVLSGSAAAVLSTAAGQDDCRHDQSQQQGKKFFHTRAPFIFIDGVSRICRLSFPARLP